MSDELIIHSVKGAPCDCDVLSTCFNSDCVHTVVKTWDELVALLKDVPHMRSEIRIRTSKEK
jgi:hypothetical protein